MLPLLKILTVVARSWMRLRGVSVGAGGWIHGFPRLRLAPGSTVKIGDHVTLCSWARFNPLAPVRPLSFVTNSGAACILIGDEVGISNSVLSCHTSITIGRGTLIGAECLIIDSDFHGLPLGKGLPTQSAPVVVGKQVFIGARSMILKGVTVGDGAIIGAGSVVTTAVPPNTLVAGNPARIIRNWSSETQ